MDHSVLNLLRDWAGTWEGEGVNHQQQAFRAVLVVRPGPRPQSAILWFCAKGVDGAVYHEELGLLGQSFNGNEQVASISTNVPFLQSFDAADSPTGSLHFVHGDRSGVDGFREELHYTKTAEDQVRVLYRWGMPGEAIQDRSSVLLSKSQDSPPGTCPLR